MNQFAPDADDRAPAGPFDGLIIADFGRVLAGPYCTMLLADLGATVIKVESPLGDDTRNWVPPRYQDESTYFLSINRNKQSVVLDFTDPADLQLAHELAARADVVIQNFRPGGLVGYELDYDSVVKTNPNVVYASLSGFGTTGGADLPGYDLLVQALSGLMDVTGGQTTEGYRSGVAVFDVIAGLHTAIAIASALFHRQRTGVGQHVELNLMSSALSGMVNQTGGFALTGKVPSRMGNDHPSIYPFSPIPTAEGDIVLAVGNDSQFRRLCRDLGSPELAEEPRFATNAQRSANRDELRPLLTDLLSSRTANEWFDLLSASGIPCAPILDVGSGIAFAEKLGLDPVVMTGSGDRQMPTIRNPITFSRTPVTYRNAPPRLNQDGDEVRRWLSTPRPITDHER